MIVLARRGVEWPRPEHTSLVDATRKW